MQILTGTTGNNVQFDAAVLTTFDDDRSMSEILDEICEIHPDWDRDKARKKLNFGINNTRRGECSRKNENSDKSIKVKLEAQPYQLMVGGDLEAAQELTERLMDATPDQYREIHQEMFPNGSLGQDGQVKFGVEAEAQHS